MIQQQLLSMDKKNVDLDIKFNAESLTCILPIMRHSNVAEKDDIKEQ